MTQAQQALKTKTPGNFVMFQVVGGGSVRYVYDDGSYIEKRMDGSLVCGK